MNGAVELNIWQFSSIYVLLVFVAFIMKKSKIEKTNILLIGSIRMTIQLVLAGLVLQYIFKNPQPIYTVLFLIIMIAFSIHRIISGRGDLNTRFKIAIGISLTFSGLFILIFFVCVVVGENIFNPRYMIPLAGMITGNAMTGITLGLKTFLENIQMQRRKIDTLANLGVDFKTILKPFVNNALEAALIPTINSMVGMGIIFLPGMMTGQMLSGTMPTTAIMYQIAIMIAICTSVCLSVFFTLNVGYKSLYNSKNQFIG